MNGKSVIKTLISSALLVVFFYFLLGRVHAAQLPENYGWYPTVKDDKGHVTAMANDGEQGGTLTMACVKATGEIKMGYSIDGVVYDFFIVRKFGSIDMNDVAGKLIVGSGLHHQDEVYYNVMNNDKAFVVARFPVGTKHAWDEAKRLKLETAPEIQQSGDEFFLTGDAKYKTYLKEMSQYCKFQDSGKAVL